MTHTHDERLDEVGPGVWYMIHTSCGHATDAVSIAFALMLLERIALWFFCLVCRAHFNEHMAKRPPRAVAAEKGGLFRWSVDVHNEVNRSKGKREMSYEEAFELYLGEGSECHNCHKDGTAAPAPAPMSPLKHLLTRPNPHGFMIGR